MVLYTYTYLYLALVESTTRQKLCKTGVPYYVIIVRLVQRGFYRVEFETKQNVGTYMIILYITMHF